MDLGPDREPHGGAPSRPMTLAEAVAHLTGTDPRFAVEEAEIRGERYRVFAHAPPHLRALLRDSRAAHGEGDYLVHEEERWSFDAFCADACRCAHMLTEELGVRPGARVAIAMRNYPELLIAVMGIVSAGGVAVFLNAWWTADELAWALEDSDARVVLADGPRLERIRQAAARLGVRPVAVRDAEGIGEEPAWSALMGAMRDEAWPDAPIDPDDDFAVMYSSGTTGRPKGVVLTHRGAISAVFSWLMTTAAIPLMQEPPPEGTPPPPRPAMLITTPLFHVTATHPLFLLGLPMGARIVLMRKWDAEEAIRIIAREGVTRFLGVPTQSADLMDAVARTGADLPTLSYLGAGGAKRPAAQVGALAAAFPRAMVASGWGMTETNAVGLGVWGPDYLTHPEAAGRLYPPLQDLRIVGRDGAEVPLGEVGELTVRSPANMRGYLNQPEATAETLQPRLAAHGRPRHGGRHRPRHDRGSRQEHHHPRGREHLLSRRGGRAALPSGRDGGRGLPRPRRPARGGGRRRRAAARGRRGDGGGAVRLPRRAHRALQDPRAHLAPRLRSPAPRLHRQDRPPRPARSLPRRARAVRDGGTAGPRGRGVVRVPPMTGERAVPRSAGRSPRAAARPRLGPRAAR